MSGIDGNTALLLHLDGDVQNAGQAGTVVANTGVTFSDTAIFGQSGLFGSGKYLTPGYADALALGDGDFTIDWWEYRTANGDSSAVYNRRINDTAPYSTLVGFSTGGNVQAYMAAADGAWTVSALAMGTVQLNTWVHRALVRNGGTLSAYQNGVLIASTAVSGSLDTGTVPPDIGRWHYNASTLNYFEGYIDEFRLQKSAVWTEGFTPPVRPYSVPISAPSSISYGPAEAGKTLLVSWEASVDPDGDTVTYTLEHSTDGGASWTQDGAGIAGTAYSAAAPTGKPTVCYRVKASDGTEESEYCTGAAVGVLQDYQGLIVGGGTR